MPTQLPRPLRHALLSRRLAGVRPGVPTIMACLAAVLAPVVVSLAHRQRAHARPVARAARPGGKVARRDHADTAPATRAHHDRPAHRGARHRRRGSASPRTPATPTATTVAVRYVAPVPARSWHRPARADHQRKPAAPPSEPPAPPAPSRRPAPAPSSQLAPVAWRPPSPSTGDDDRSWRHASAPREQEDQRPGGESAGDE
jgi:hypothetical protein